MNRSHHLCVWFSHTLSLSLSLLLSIRIAKILLKLIQTFAPILYSYGNNDNGVLPYIVSPLEYNAETFIATSPGEDPPMLGSSLRDGRNIMEGTKFNTHDTYTFRFSSLCLDFLQWQLRIGDYTINLEKFWGNSSVRLIAYDEAQPLTDSNDSNHIFTIYSNVSLLAVRSSDYSNR